MKKHVATYGMLIALALVASYIERWIPLDIGIPGVKLGLANIVTMVALYMLSFKETMMILFVRILLSGLLFSNGFAIVYSLAGGILSLFAMYPLKKYRAFSVMGVSVAGGIAHNIGQLLVAMVVLENKNLVYYLPALLIAGTICGMLVGILGGLLMNKLPKNLFCVVTLLCITGVTFTGCNKQVNNHGFAMSTVINRSIYGADAEEADERVMECINQVDQQLSWRKENSELANINAAAGTGKPVTMSSDMTEWMKTIQEFSIQNPGTVTPLMGPVIEQWNFSQEQPVVPKKKELEQALTYVKEQHLLIEGNHILLKQKENKLDFGAYGKGIACDRIYQVLKEYELDGAMVSMGNSSMITYGTKPDGTSWQIGIQHPRKEQGQLLGVLSVEGTAFISTSGDYERYMILDGKRYHHILDPNTGYPAESGLSSVTVIGESGLLCDAVSTACFILGKEKGMELLERYDMGGIFVETNGEITEKLKGNATFRQE